MPGASRSGSTRRDAGGLRRSSAHTRVATGDDAPGPAGPRPRGAGVPLPDSDAGPLGILAGGSGLPLELADAAIHRGRPVHIVAIAGAAQPAIERYPHTWVNMAGIGAMLAAFRAAGCRQIVIVGGVRRPNILSLRPDLGFVLALPVLLGMLRGGDDSILRAVVGFFERHGLEVVGAHDAAPDLLVRHGQLGAVAPTLDQLASIETATGALAALGPFDIAQAAVAIGPALLAVEGADGTDAMLGRLSRRARTAGRGVLVKLPKAQQERRIDLPTIGPETVRRAVEAGLAGIAVRADGTLVAERGEMIRIADASGIFVHGIAEAHPPRPPGHAVPDAAPGTGASGDGEGDGEHDHLLAGLRSLGRIKATATASDDARLGARVIAALEPFWPRSSALVSRGYVLAAEDEGGALAALDRADRLKPWGTRALRANVGVLVMTDIAGEIGFDPRRLIVRAGLAKLAGLAVLRAPIDDRALAALATAADEAGLFLLAPGGAL